MYISHKSLTMFEFMCFISANRNNSLVVDKMVTSMSERSQDQNTGYELRVRNEKYIKF